MSELREIDIQQVKATISVDKINYVDKRLVEMANEYRIYFDVFLAIFFLLLGLTISNYNPILLAFTIIFFILTIIFFLRYYFKNKIPEQKAKEPIEPIKYYYTNYLKLKYPIDGNGNIFQLIKSEAKPGYVYLHDFSNDYKYHVGSRKTFEILGYTKSMIKSITPEKFNSLKEGEKILITH